MEDDDVEEDEEKDENVAEDEVEDGDVAEDEVEDDDVEDDEVEVKEEEDDDVENDDVEEEEDDDVEDDYVEHDDVEEEDRSQDLGPHFVRACAAQMHINMSQETFFYGNLQVKCRRPEPRPTLCASLGSRNALQHFTRATLYRNLQVKCRGLLRPLKLDI